MHRQGHGHVALAEVAGDSLLRDAWRHGFQVPTKKRLQILANSLGLNDRGLKDEVFRRVLVHLFPEEDDAGIDDLFTQKNKAAPLRKFPPSAPLLSITYLLLLPTAYYLSAGFQAHAAGAS